MREKKREKREREALTEADMPLPIRERLRNQWEVLDFERRTLESMDKSVRYGLLIFAMANALAAVILSRAGVMLTLTPKALLATHILAAIYAIVAIAILLNAGQSLRPGYTPKDLANAAAPSGQQARRLRVLQTLMPTSVDRASLTSLHDSWRSVTGEELSWELTQACLFLRSLVEIKYHALRRLFTNLGLMLLLAVVIGIVAAILSTL